MPTRRKEVSFFDQYFDRGLDWYSQFFPQVDKAPGHVGEISPRYVDDEETLRRLVAFPGADRYIMMVRHPLKRLVSSYLWRVRNWNYQGSLRELIAAENIHVHRSCFGRHIAAMSRLTDREKLLVLVLEEVHEKPEEANLQLADFLAIDPAGFASHRNSLAVNANTLPRHRKLYAVAQSVRKRLVSLEMDWVINISKRAGIKSILTSRDTADPSTILAEHQDLMDLFTDDIQSLEEWLGRPIDSWRNS